MQWHTAEFLQHPLGGAPAADIHQQGARAGQVKVAEIGAHIGGTLPYGHARRAPAEGGDLQQQLGQLGVGGTAAQVKHPSAVIAGQLCPGGKAAEGQNVIHPHDLPGQRVQQQCLGFRCHGTHEQRRAETAPGNAEVAGLLLSQQAADLPHQVHIPGEKNQSPPGPGIPAAAQPAGKGQHQRPHHRVAEGFLRVVEHLPVVGTECRKSPLCPVCGFGEIVGARQAAGQFDTADARQCRTHTVGAAVVPQEQDIAGGKPGLFQKQPEKLAAALLHAVLRRDKKAVGFLIAAGFEHGGYGLGGQVHIGYDIHLLPPRPAGTVECLHFPVRHRQCGFGADLRLRVEALQLMAGVDLRQCHFPGHAGCAGFRLGSDTPGGKALGCGAVCLHPGKHIGWGGGIPVDQGIEHVESHRPVTAGKPVKILHFRVRRPFRKHKNQSFPGYRMGG